MSVLGLEEKFETFLSVMDSRMPQCCNQIRNELKASAPWNDKTGALRSTMKGDCSGGHGNYTMVFAYGQDYGKYLEEGTGPHVINGNDYLYWEGCAHPVRRVNHPGIKATHHLEKTVDAGVMKIASAIESCWPG